MSKHDLYHDEVKAALIKDGWTITHDPLTIPGIGLSSFHIDLGAEMMIGAEKAGEKIAVEIKSFTGISFTNDFHVALGQFINYLFALKSEEPDRELFLAVSDEIYDSNFYDRHITNIIEGIGIKILIFEPSNQTIVQWKK